jgi:hypothetical protein
MTKTLLVQNFNTKFIKNTIYSIIDDTTIINADIDNNLYKSHYRYNFTHIIFAASLLSTEVIQFISDFSQSVKIFLYHDTFIDDAANILSNTNITHIVNNNYINDKYNIININPYIINTNLFNKNGQSNIRNNSIIGFLDHYNFIPNHLNNYLYPKTKLPIKIFNATNSQHHQNLGLVNDIEKSQLLKSNKYYLSLDYEKDYSIEAQACGAIVVHPDQLSDLDNVSYTDHPEIMDHKQFIIERILA